MPQLKKQSAQDKHWDDWQKRHRAPRAIDVLNQTRVDEARRKKESEEEATPDSEDNF